MNPKHKTLLIVSVVIASVFIVPIAIVLLHNYLNAFFAITLFVTCFVVFGYYSYEELLPILQREYIEEQQILHRFNGDKEKIRLYKGFKKHFDGDLNLEQLETWFKNHPPIQ